VAEISRLRQRQTAPLILELDLTEGVPEGPATDPLSAVMSIRKIRLTDIIEGLRRASHDDRVRVLVTKVGGGRIGLARMQEVREAIAEFRASGKLTVAWAAAAMSRRLASLRRRIRLIAFTTRSATNSNPTNRTMTTMSSTGTGIFPWVVRRLSVC
jgi:hypothetical protein